MGTLASSMTETSRSTLWFWEFLKGELAPFPGRAAIVARLVLAATLVMIICETFRIPTAFQGAIYALLISRESTQATVRAAVTMFVVTLIGAAYLLISVYFVISVPSLHFFWNITSFFLVFYAILNFDNLSAGRKLADK